jgi:predicted RNase H-like HicB family nuclease
VSWDVRQKQYCSPTLGQYRSDVIIKAVVHKAKEGGFWAEVPSLPGCVTQGESQEEIRANLQEAIELWLEAGDPKATQDQESQIVEVAV